MSKLGIVVTVGFHKSSKMSKSSRLEFVIERTRSDAILFFHLLLFLMPRLTLETYSFDGASTMWILDEEGVTEASV